MGSDKGIGDWRSFEQPFNDERFDRENRHGDFFWDDKEEEMSSNKRRKLNAETETQGETLLDPRGVCADI